MACTAATATATAATTATTTTTATTATAATTTLHRFFLHFLGHNKTMAKRETEAERERE